MKKNSLLISVLALVIAVSFGAAACSQKVEETTTSETTALEITVEATEETEATTETTIEEPPTDPAAYEYSLVWEENFDGDELDRDMWNVELHNPYWVNNELQYYLDSEDCIYVEDGDLVIQPLKVLNEETGEYEYHSGRINSRGNADFKYGRIEARIRVPEGQGFLPAFWMMPSTDSFGSWPRSGEIDIMEVLGSETDTTYGTIHFGNPHEQRQSSYTLEEGSFSSDYHVFAIEWEPGLIRWLVDDVEIGTANDWFTGATPNVPMPYPAPFNKPFHVILNVAVGGSWPGDPDSTTVFDERAQMRVDYVRVYQRGWYDENVSAPEHVYHFRYPDSDGNFVSATDWEFYENEGGVGTLTTDSGVMTITTSDAGTVDYSIQLVNNGIPAEDGSTYVVTFDAMADENRTMIAAVTAPDHGYIRYMEDETVDLTTSWQTYSYTYTLSGTSDDNSRLEFNMGGTDSSATIYLRNVTIVKN